jgi:hypothetical protein
MIEIASLPSLVPSFVVTRKRRRAVDPGCRPEMVAERAALS